MISSDGVLKFLMAVAQHSNNVCLKCDNPYNKQHIIICECGKDFYCSQKCMEINKSKHLKLCTTTKNKQNDTNIEGKNPPSIPIDMKITQYSLRGQVGLQNLGNTCYINSLLQCLSHTQQLTSYFLNKHYFIEINMDNQLGTKGKFVNAYATLIQNLWCKSSRIFKPTQIKKQLGELNMIFKGKNQQDAQQLFNILIDTLHEDLNRVKKKQKPKKLIQNTSKLQNQLAITSWLNYILRNQSIITNLMTGLFKSETTCLKCNKVTKTFEPYNVIVLPIPDQIQINDINLYIMYSNFVRPICITQISIDTISASHIIEKAAKHTKLSKNKFKLYFMSSKYEIVKIQSLNKESLKQRLIHDKLFLIQLTPEEEKIINKFGLICSVGFHTTQKRFCHLGYKRSFIINLKTETGLSLMKKILRFLYNDSYIDKQRKTLQGIEGNDYYTFQQEIMVQKAKNKYFIQILICKVRKRIYENGHITLSYEQQNIIKDQMLIYDAIKQMVPNHLHQSDSDLQQLIQVVVTLSQEAKGLFKFERLKWDSKDQIFIHKDQNKRIPIQKCFQSFRNQQQLQKENELHCDQCGEKMNAKKKMNIFKTPDILVLNINRFKSSNGTNAKNEKFVQFPFQLNLQKYVQNLKPMSQYIEFAQSSGLYIKPAVKIQPCHTANQEYELYAVINHIGTLKSGHYFAYAYNYYHQKWFEYNDSTIQPIDKNKIISQNAYMLFYQRRDRMKN